MKASTALITGASSGLGAEYARQLAARGFSLVLVARNQESLEHLATEIEAQHGVRIEVIAADLLLAAGIEAVESRLFDEDRPIRVLVNNAGFGLPLDFENNDITEEVRHLRLHNEVQMRLSHAALQGMLARGSGTILNIASVAAFIPRSTYSASKQWLVVFSRWANARYLGRGVTVTAVCPGFTHTNFHERMGLAPGEEGVPSWMWLNAKQVVAESLRDAAHKKAVSIPSLRYKFLAALARIVPGEITARVGERGRI